MKKAKWHKRYKKSKKSYKGFKTFLNGEEVNEKEETKEEPTLVTPEINEVNMDDIPGMQPKTDDITVNAEDIKVVLPFRNYLKMMTYVKMVNSEINGLGLVEKTGDATFKITEIYLLDQKVTGAYCDIDGLSFTKLMEKLIEEGKNPSMIRFWWHSHNTMGTFWSTTDEETGKKFAGSEYFISLVACHNGDMRARINIYQPVAIEIDNIKILIENPLPDENIISECKTDIEKCVKKEETPILSYSGYCHNEKQTEFPYGENTNDKEEEKQTAKEVDIANCGPWGDDFIDGTIRLLWDKQQQKYLGYDIHTNMALSEKELIERASVDYNAYLDEN